MITKAIFIGDVHGEFQRLEQIICFNKNNLPMFCTGDIPISAINGEADDSIEKCIKLLKENSVATVKGNHDSWLNKDFDFISKLPLTLDIATSAGKALFCHGIGNNYMSKINPDDYGYAIESNDDLHNIIKSKDYKFIINGHSHKKMIKKVSNIVIINAGSLKHDPGFIIADFLYKSVTFLKFSDLEISIEKSESLE